jgi:lysophospholipase L1-like esterase
MRLQLSRLAAALVGSSLIACGSSDASAPVTPDPALTPPVMEPPAASPTGEVTPSTPPAEDTPLVVPGTGGELDTDHVGPIDDGSPEPASDDGASGAEDDGAEDDGDEPVDPSTLPAIRLWIAGDSTVANGQTPCPRGWGGVIGSRFDARVTVNNLAQGGRSVHTWLYNVLTTMDASGECELTRDASGEPTLQPRWQQMLDEMGEGDYLLIQFGINDGDRTCDRHVGIEAFKESYGMMAEAAKARGAHPVFLTPVSSIACNGTTARGSRGEFVPATQEAGITFEVPVIDLHERSVALYQSLAFCPVAGGDVSADTTGPVGDFFCDDHTHFSAEGIQQIADLVVQGLREQNIPLAGYLK